MRTTGLEPDSREKIFHGSWVDAKVQVTLFTIRNDLKGSSNTNHPWFELIEIKNIIVREQGILKIFLSNYYVINKYDFVVRCLFDSFPIPDLTHGIRVRLTLIP